MFKTLEKFADKENKYIMVLYAMVLYAVNNLSTFWKTIPMILAVPGNEIL